MSRISPDIESLIHRLKRAWRFEYQDPDACGGFIEKITPAEYKSIVDGLGALSAGLAQCQQQWQPIETIPEDRPIQAWHTTWKCPVSIQKRSWGDRSAWVEKTLTTEWPLEAFSHWMEVTASPDTSTDRPPQAWLDAKAEIDAGWPDPSPLGGSK